MKKVKPDYLKKVDALAVHVSRSIKLNTNTSRLVAHGIMELLRLKCWQELTDVLGSVDDIDTICRWEHTQDWLASRLEMVGLIGKIPDSDDYFLPNVAKDLPEFQRKKWRRYDPGTYEIAAKRIITEQLDNKGAYQKRPLKRKPTLDGLEHQELIEYWTKIWSKRYGGRKYPFKPRDAKNIKDLKTEFKTKERCKEILDLYINDNDAFTVKRAHILGGLIGNLPRYVGGTARSTTQRELPYGG